MTRIRCKWAKHDLEIEYHDKEWGVPVFDDQKLFEYVILDIFQAGLSWLTILKKREHFKTAFDQFDCNKIIHYDQDKINELMYNKNIIRNNRKIHATISNSFKFKEIQDEFGSFSTYVWSFVDHKQIVNEWNSLEEIPAFTDESDKMSKDMKRRGFSFVGTTICYAFMQAAGMVNDHVAGCFRYEECML